MAGRLEVDPEGLKSDGRDLAAIPNPKANDANGLAPAADPVSKSIEAALAAHTGGLTQRLNEAKAVREHGGSIVIASGEMFEAADEHGALEISKVEIVGRPRPASAGPPSIDQLPQPKMSRSAPRVPAIASQSLEPEAFSEAIHNDGLGSGELDVFAIEWKAASSDIHDYSLQTRNVADRMDEHWNNARDSASSNVREHASWMNEVSRFAAKLGSAADDCAGAFDLATRKTPTPEQLKTAKRAMQLSVLSPVTYLIAKMKYEELKNKAREAGVVYQMTAQSAVLFSPHLPEAPELIARRAEIPNDLTKGPGSWVSAVRTEGQEWRDYEQQVTGYPAGMEYEVIGPDGVAVEFDGYDPDTGLLLEAKGNYEWAVGPDGEFKPGFGPAASIPAQLERQHAIAEATGIPVEWRVAGPKAAEAIQRILVREGYQDMIDVVVVPPE